ncbi:MAG TPA: hypothetical protein VK081_14950, partial [Planctomycetota bacterium]|nr:hypothetical protein [Planctomycetota bacterium]
AGDAVYADFVRRGHEGVLSVEVEPGQEVLLPRLAARVLLPDGRGAEVTLLRAGERRLEARVPLTGEGVYRATVAVEGAGEVVSVPPITLPYSPEFERRLDPEAGARELARLVGITGGRIDPPVGELFSGSRDGVGLRPLAPLCAWLLLAALLGEIAVRRLGLSLPRVVRQKPASAREAARPSPATAAANAAVPEERPARAHRDERRVEGLGSILQRSKERAGRQTDRR